MEGKPLKVLLHQTLENPCKWNKYNLKRDIYLPLPAESFILLPWGMIFMDIATSGLKHEINSKLTT